MLNRCPSTALNLKTPEEAWSGHPANYSRLKVFGCTTYAHVKQDKLQPRALKCIFLGYPEGVKGYKLWCLEPGFRKCLISRDVVFNETEMVGLTNKEEGSAHSKDASSTMESRDEIQVEVEPMTFGPELGHTEQHTVYQENRTQVER